MAGSFKGAILGGMAAAMCHTPFPAQAASRHEQVVYSFQSRGDGAQANGGLAYVNGDFYGTTEYDAPDGVGAVFKVTPAGAETVVHAFTGGNDGDTPLAGLVNVKGTLYGTTLFGGGSGCGDNGCGTVYAISPAGAERIVYAFQSYQDGAEPQSRLIYWNGTLYGTTTVGGTSGFGSGYGTVFSVTPAGAETILHKFVGGSDGSEPAGALLEWQGNFYGVTEQGGRAAACNLGCGTVFKVTPSGTETVLYAFKAGSDGAGPTTGLLASNGVFYGATSGGGQYGFGTVFSLTPGGTEKILYSFQNGADGAYPDGGLTLAPGGFYGTTFLGGGSTCDNHGCGTIYHVTKDGAEHVVFTFGKAGLRGNTPVGTLLNQGGVFWGATQLGGAENWGTVFAWTP
jgi:uncharacterized repeat protein (TIGR03803 family)